MGLSAEIRRALLEAAIAAPSADNSQPWRFSWHDRCIDLSIDPDRSGGVSDGRYLLSDLASGACLENVCIAAHAAGWFPQVHLFPALDTEPLRVARIILSPGQADDIEMARAIKLRHTDRSFPWKGAIPNEARCRLNQAFGRLGGSRLIWLDEADNKRRALSAIRIAEELRFRDKRLHAELFDSIRFDVGWHSAACYGLSPQTLQIAAPMRPVFSALRRWRVINVLNRIGGARLLGLRAGWLPARLGGELCLVASSVPASREAVVQAARSLERFWLRATLEGYSVQPFAAAGVLSLGFCEVEAASKKTVQQLKGLMEALAPNAVGLTFLRIGRGSASRNPPRCGRRALNEFFQEGV